MERTAIPLGSAVFLYLVSALPGLADSSLPQPGPGPQVLGAGSSGDTGAGGTAFTGSDMSIALVGLTVLVVAGVSLFILRKVRAAQHL